MTTSGIHLRQSPGVLSRNVGGEVILAAPDKTSFDRLSESAGMVWSLLDVPRTAERLVEMLADAYGEPQEAIGPDIDGLLADLLRRGWIEEAR